MRTRKRLAETFPDGDIQLLRRVCEKDPMALEILYDRHAPALLAVAARILGKAEEAEDVLQEAWIQIWNRAELFREERGSAEAWMHRIVRNRAIDRHRQLAASHAAVNGFAASVAPGLGAQRPATQGEPDVTDRIRDRDELAFGLAGLEAQQREVLEIAYFEGLSQVEVARRLGRPLGTIKSWMRKGLQSLRASIPQEAVDA